MNSGVPIKPSEVPAAKAVVIPPFVFNCFNKCIALHFSNGRAHFTLGEVVKMVKEECDKHNIEYNPKWMDVEDSYRAQGWKVEYDAPGYCESYPSKFIFTEIK